MRDLCPTDFEAVIFLSELIGYVNANPEGHPSQAALEDFGDRAMCLRASLLEGDE